jgi:hypothetical protein
MTHQEPAVRQLTLRGFDPELERRIQKVARDEGISLNQAVLRLLRKGAGLDTVKEDDDVVGAALDDLIGTWSDEEAEEFDRAVSDFDAIDEEMWR